MTETEDLRFSSESWLGVHCLFMYLFVSLFFFHRTLLVYFCICYAREGPQFTFYSLASINHVHILKGLNYLPAFSIRG